MKLICSAEQLEKVREFMDHSFCTYSGITADTDENGQLVLSVAVQPHHLNPNGVVHGGLLYTLLDTAGGCYARLARGFEGMETTQSGNIYYIRPGTGRELHTRCEIIHFGRTTCLVHVDILDENDRLLAYGESSLFHIPAK